MASHSPTRLLPVIGYVALALIVVEVGLLQARPMLSGDIRHLDEVPSIVERLAKGEGLKVLVAGNSLVGAGVEPDSLASSLGRRLESSVAVDVVRPDGTGPLEWEYLFRRALATENGFDPGGIDVVILGFGPGHLRDGPPGAVIPRLALHHVGAGDIGVLFERHLDSFEDRANFLLSRYWGTFGLRDRVSARVLAGLIPGYRERAGLLLRSQTGASADGAAAPSYSSLERLLDFFEHQGLTPMLLAMPAPGTYSIDPAVMDLSRVRAIPLLDGRNVEGIDARSFRDVEHLNESGRVTFTRSLTPLVAEVLAR